MSAFVVNLKSNKLISVRGSWVETPILDEESRIFYSPNSNDEANFEIQASHFFHVNETACYIGRIDKQFETLEAADQWLHERPRRIPNVYKRFNQPNVVETLDLCDETSLISENGHEFLEENAVHANNMPVGEKSAAANIKNDVRDIDMSEKDLGFDGSQSGDEIAVHKDDVEIPIRQMSEIDQSFDGNQPGDEINVEEESTAYGDMNIESTNVDEAQLSAKEKPKPKLVEVKSNDDVSRITFKSGPAPEIGQPRHFSLKRSFTKN